MFEPQNLTGGVLVSQEQNKVILFRGWAEGKPKPEVTDDEDLSPELIEALKIEDAGDHEDENACFMRECSSVASVERNADFWYDGDSSSDNEDDHYLDM